MTSEDIETGVSQSQPSGDGGRAAPTYTPGPWYMTAAANYYGITGTTQVARTAISPRSVMSETGIANARLIAAAPELLEACQAFLTAFDTGKPAEAVIAAQAQCRVAISKATGGAS